MVYLNTKADFFNYLYDNMPGAVQQLQNLVDDRYAWEVVAVLENKSEGIEDETHLIIESEDEILQSELKENEYAELFRLGFTVEEAEAIIANPQKALDDYRAKQEDVE